MQNIHVYQILTISIIYCSKDNFCALMLADESCLPTAPLVVSVNKPIDSEQKWTIPNVILSPKFIVNLKATNSHSFCFQLSTGLDYLKRKIVAYGSFEVVLFFLFQYFCC